MKIGFIAFVSLLSFQLFAQELPNILLITADDMGYDDVSAHGSLHSQTPNLDDLAQQAITFSDFSVSPVCATTRASLLTGKHFYKTGVSGVHGGRDYMHLSEKILPEILKQKGYKSGMWGKWHTGKSEGYFPWDRGFDEAYYAELYRHENSFGFFNGDKVEHNEWVSKVVTDYALAFMEKNKAQPFLAYVSFLAPHEPWLAPKEYTQPFLEEGMRPATANLYGMISEMDFHIGRLMDYLKTSGLIENTIVIFLSDNGPWWDSSNFGAMKKDEWLARNPTQMNGNKGQSWQNGIRSPLFVSWPSRWTPANVERYVDVKDILPTLMDIAEMKTAPDSLVEGESFLPYLEGKTEGVNHRFTYIASHNVVSSSPHFNQWTPVDKEVKSALELSQQPVGIRTERYKLLLNPASDNKKYPKAVDGWALFDMQSDPLERTNIVGEQPDIASELKHKLERYFNEITNSVNSYAPPVYLISQDRPSIVNGFGPSSTRGNTTSEAHVLTSLRSRGDYARYDLNVASSGRYDIYLSQRDTHSVGLLVKLTTQSDKLEYEFNENSLQKIGSVNLKKGTDHFKLAVLKNNSQKPWTAINGLRHIFVVPNEAELVLKDLSIPN